MTNSNPTNFENDKDKADNTRTPKKVRAEKKQVEFLFCFRCGAPSSGDTCQVCNYHYCPTCGDA